MALVSDPKYVGSLITPLRILAVGVVSHYVTGAHCRHLIVVASGSLVNIYQESLAVSECCPCSQSEVATRNVPKAEESTILACDLRPAASTW